MVEGGGTESGLKKPSEINGAVDFSLSYPNLYEAIRQSDRAPAMTDLSDMAVGDPHAIASAMAAVIPLAAQLDAFNIFAAFNAGNSEIRHSNFLAYLFDQHASHGHGVRYLKRLLMLLEKRAGRPRGSFSLIESLTECTVHREFPVGGKNRIDLLLEFPKEQFLIVIENKIHALQGSGQLEKYRKGLEKAQQFAAYEKVYVFLTLAPEPPEDPAYVGLLYEELVTVVIQPNEARTHTDAAAKAVLFSHYAAVVAGHAQDFNLLEALGAGLKELRHSNFLAWALEPRNGHGFEDRFLRHFLNHAMGEDEPLPDDLSDVEVRREYQGIDILIVSERAKLVVVIENKTRSRQGKGQLEKYRRRIEVEYHDFRRHFVFLTLIPEKPEDSNYVRFGYEVIASGLSKLSDAYRDSLPSHDEQIDLCIGHYAHLIRWQLVAGYGGRILFPSAVANACSAMWQRESSGLTDLVLTVESWRIKRRKELTHFLWELAEQHFAGCRKRCSKKGPKIERPIWLRFIPEAFFDLEHWNRSAASSELDHMIPHYTFHKLPFGNPDPKHGNSDERLRRTILFTLGLAKPAPKFTAMFEALYAEMHRSPAIFNTATTEKARGTAKSTTVISMELAGDADLRTRKWDELCNVIEARFARFVAIQHPEVVRLLKSIQPG